jgi:hypothetical protein
MTTKWEYCAIKINNTEDKKKVLKYFSPTKDHKLEEITDPHETIAKLGNDGWELIFLTDLREPNAKVYYFKRPN